ncbi:MAG: energy transducer TonB [Polyangiales bacterium]
MRTQHIVYGISAFLHIALGSAVAAVRPPPVRETVRITMREVRRPRTPPPPPPAAPQPPAPAAAAAPAPTPAPPAPSRSHAPRSHAPRPTPSAPTPAPSNAPSAPPDFGVSLGNEGGMAVPGGGHGNGGGGAASHHEAPAPERPAASDGCDEAPARPRVVEMPEPDYPDAAREEGIEGRVRVELTLDDEGRVTGARVLQGLGHGLDEAALAAARGARFEPATRCGRAVGTTFTLAVRFTL